ncbi:MAG TPA: toll/interleukin-1 receptor domain-containing protein [Candidatus Acidoferrum sp.]|nr:toll/interleukin-1 receptor domain-containing protein [Candidatus Acidoferrum sp.]
MQALTRTTLFPCYAEADRPLVERVVAFVERGAEVRCFLEEGAMAPGDDLAAKAREARTADLVLVFFSRASLPSRWPRAQWEDALVKEPAAEAVRIAFVRCDDCTPPRVLVPAFEANRLREIKRWVRGSSPAEVAAPEHVPDLEVLGIAIADRAGSETTPSFALADEFARVFRPDFDAVIRLETCQRRLAAIAGDLGRQIGLRLEGGLPENLERLRAFCEERRFLIVQEGGEAPELVFGGQTSTLICDEAGPPSRDPLRAIHATFDTEEDWAVLCQAARQGRRMARDLGRIAELYDLMQAWAAMARAREDRIAQDEAAREIVWIMEGWGQPDEARRVEFRRSAELDEQMPLLFEL